LKLPFDLPQNLKAPLLVVAAVGGLMLLLVAIMLVFAVQITGLSTRIERRNELLLEQLRNNTDQLDFLKQNVLLLAQDSNSIRDALKLPEQPYPILAPPQATQDAGGAVRADTPFLAGLEVLMRSRDRLISETKFRSVISSPLMAQVVASGKFSQDRTSPQELLLKREGQPFFYISIDPVSQSIKVMDFLGQEIRLLQLDSRFTDFVRERTPLLEEHFRKLQESLKRLRSVYANDALAQVLSAHNLTLSPITKGPANYAFSVLRGTSPLLTVRLNERTLAVFEGDKRFSNVSEFVRDFAQDLSSLDLRTPLQRRVDASRAEVAGLAKDHAFMSLLSARHLKFVTTPRQDNDYYYYDIEDSQGHRIGSFGVEKRVGEIDLLDSQNVLVSTLQTVALDQKDLQKKN